MTIRKSFTLVFAAAFLALAPGLRADQPAVREKPPEPDAPRPFKIPAPTRFSLPNGLKVSLVPYGTVPKLEVDRVAEGDRTRGLGGKGDDLVVTGKENDGKKQKHYGRNKQAFHGSSRAREEWTRGQSVDNSSCSRIAVRGLP